MGGGEVCFSVGKGFEKKKVGFLSQTKVQKIYIHYIMYLKRHKFSLGVSFEG